MPQTEQSIAYTTKNNMCICCGICASACPTNSIKVVVKKGLNIPIIDEKSCMNTKGCHKCMTVCPGVGVDIKAFGKKLFEPKGSYYKEKTGYYYSSYFGYSLDNEIRFHSASGGLVTQFLIFLLDKGFISGAVVTTFDNSQPLQSKTIIARTKEEIIAAKSSKYAPVSYEGIIEQIKSKDGQYVIVGLPCHIHGFRKYEATDKKFKEHIFGYFGLYCSAGRSFYLTEYVFQYLGIQREQLKYFAYRDNGCLGSLNAIEDTEGREKTTQIPYQLYYHPLRSFFIPNRCNLCIDHYAELADVSFGDIHYGEFKKDKIGTNSLVVRNPKFDKLLNEAMNAKIVHIEPLDYDTLIKCQSAIKNKKGRVGTILKVHKLLGNAIPKYDVQITDPQPVKSVLYYFFAKVQMFIGKRKSLWFIISLMKRNKKVD